MAVTKANYLSSVNAKHFLREDYSIILTYRNLFLPVVKNYHGQYAGNTELASGSGKESGPVYAVSVVNPYLAEKDLLAIT